MNSVQTVAALNRLSVIHSHSLPMYLSYAGPWTRAGMERARETLAHIVADQQRTADRIGEMILDLDGDVESGEFPMAFTSLHDLSIDYLLRVMIEGQRNDIAAIEACVEQLAAVPRAKAVAEEALGAAKGHLDSLEELARQPSSAAS